MGNARVATALAARCSALLACDSPPSWAPDFDRSVGAVVGIPLRTCIQASEPAGRVGSVFYAGIPMSRKLAVRDRAAAKLLIEPQLSPRPEVTLMRRTAQIGSVERLGGGASGVAARARCFIRIGHVEVAMTGHELIALMFAVSNALRLFSYLPQILRVAQDHDGARAISCLTWNLWIAANASTALYAWTHLHDWKLTVVNAGNTVCCASVVLLTLAKRARHSHATRPALPVYMEAAMSLNFRSRLSNLAIARHGAGALALGIVATMLVGALLFSRNLPGNVQATTTVAAASTPTLAESPRLDAGVDWSRLEVASDEPGTSVAAYER